MTEKPKLAEATENMDLDAVREINSIIHEGSKKELKQLLTEIAEEEVNEKRDIFKRVIMEHDGKKKKEQEEQERLEREKMEEEERLEQEKQEEEERRQARQEEEERRTREAEELRRKELAGLDNEIKLCPLHFGKDQPCFSACALNVSNGSEPYCLIVMLAGAIGDITGQRTYQ
jgi:ABC-type multidrug transport system ATPase subunit